MPTYDYQCYACKHHWEDYYKIDDRKIPEQNPCPKCKKENEVKILLGAVPHMDIMATSLGKAKHQPTSEFKEVMKNVKNAHPHGTSKEY